MDKNLKKILTAISFEEKYMALYHKNKSLSATTELSHEDILRAFKALSMEVEYFKKESFFKLVSLKSNFHFQLNIAISDTRINFILYVENKNLKLKAGGPYGLLARQINKKLKAYHKITYNSFDTLLAGLKVGFNLFHEIKQGFLKLLEDEQ